MVQEIDSETVKADRLAFWGEKYRIPGASDVLNFDALQSSPIRLKTAGTFNAGWSYLTQEPRALASARYPHNRVNHNYAGENFNTFNNDHGCKKVRKLAGDRAR